MDFQLSAAFKPTGDQPDAIKKLFNGVGEGLKHQVLLGVTGSGKTFTVANIIEKTKLPTLVISHNKTLAAQLYQEFRDFFSNNGVSYFVSYYDYYQPEAYIPRTDTYIEKEVDINDEIDRLRLQATTHLFTRRDVIVVASVSCIYNLGSPLEWQKNMLNLKIGEKKDKREIIQSLVNLQYERNDYDLKRGSFRVKGDSLELWPAYESNVVLLRFLDDKIEKMIAVDPVTGNFSKKQMLNLSDTTLTVYPAKHFMTDRSKYTDAFLSIKSELQERVFELEKEDKMLEAHRLKQKVNFDLEMIEEVGYVSGIENYSRYFDGREPGDPPYTLFDYFSENYDEFLVVVDESHMTIPQIGAMYRGDRSRKETLIDFGFRLPSALDNRPLRFDEFLLRVPQAIYTSATPGEWETSMARSSWCLAVGRKPKMLSSKSAKNQKPKAKTYVVEQLIRPTGLLDPVVSVRPTKSQVDDLMAEIEKRVKLGQRVLVTTLTKRMAEALSEYLKDKKIKVNYLHSDIVTLDRSDILDNLRKGKYDVLVGINLLREGLDLPEVSLVAILDADKEGFLRSKTALIQTMGRAARHVNGKVIMYADKMTGSMKSAIDEVKRRRRKQLAYNRLHKIFPKTIKKPIRKKLIIRETKKMTGEHVIALNKREFVDLKRLDFDSLVPQDRKKLVRGLTKKMNKAAKLLDFELAASLRDAIEKIKT